MRRLAALFLALMMISSPFASTDYAVKSFGAIADLQLEDAQLPNLPDYNVKSFGAIADGYSHPLSLYYKTIEAARVDYPEAQSLNDEKDWAAFQRAVNAAAGRPILVPTGTYVINREITYETTSDTSGAVIRGEGRYQTIIDNRVTDGYAFRFWSTTPGKFQRGGRLEDLSVTRGISVSNSGGVYIRGVFQMTIENVSVQGLSGDGILIEVENLDNNPGGDDTGPVLNTIRRCWLSSNAGWGIRVETIGSNVGENSFLQIEDSFITLNSAGGIRWRGVIGRIVNNAISLNRGGGGLVVPLAGGGNSRLLEVENNDFEHNENIDIDLESCISCNISSNEFLHGDPAKVGWSATKGVDIGSTGGTVQNLTLHSNFFRVDPNLSPFTAFTLINTNVQNTTIEQTRWFQFDQPGQMRFSNSGMSTKIFDDGRDYPFPWRVNAVTLEADAEYTPNPDEYTVHNITLSNTGNSGNASYSINRPSPMFEGYGSTGKMLVMQIFNNTSGPVTVNFSAFFLVDSSYEAPAVGKRRTAMFMWDQSAGSGQGRWVQIGAWSADL